ncbi:MAG: hypothetical protein RLZZ381_1710 [Cyanobacteriota bacterium]|jgi:Uma2 family endonuclease
MEAIAIPKGFRVTPEQFEQLAYTEQLTRLELTKDGELIVMSPTGGEAGEKNFNLYIDLGIWNRQTRLGKAFDSSTVFVLPNGARRSPDVSWVKLERWDTLTLQEKRGFPPIAPDFAIELVSPNDLKNQRYEDLQAKMTSDPAPTKGARASVRFNRERARMQEYLDNGVKLGWLIEPEAKIVEIYRVGQQVEILNKPTTLSGEDSLPGFSLYLSEIF